MICITFNKLKTTGECRYHNNMASIARPRNKDAWNLKLKCHQILCSAMHKQESTCMIKGDELDSLLLFRCQLVEGRKAIWVFNSNFFLIISNNNVSSILRKKKKKKLGVSVYFDDSGHGKKTWFTVHLWDPRRPWNIQVGLMVLLIFFSQPRPLTPSLSSQFCSRKSPHVVILSIFRSVYHWFLTAYQKKACTCLSCVRNSL